MDRGGTRSGLSRMVEEGLSKACSTLSDGTGGGWGLGWECAQSTGGLSGRSQMTGERGKKGSRVARALTGLSHRTDLGFNNKCRSECSYKGFRRSWEAAPSTFFGLICHTEQHISKEELPQPSTRL